MRKFDAILFDFDGTLFDTIPLIIDSYQQTYYKMFGDWHEPESIVKGIGLPLEEVFEKDYPGHGEALLKAYTDYNHANLHHVGVFNGIIPMLEELKATGTPLGVVTAKRADAMRPTVELFEVEDLFEVFVTKFDTEEHKPNPAPLYFAMDKLGLDDPRHVLYVGDAVWDIRAAKNGKLQSAAVGWSPTERAILEAEAPDYFIERPEDLVALARQNR